MKIEGFFCDCVGRRVAKDHYSSGSCKKLPAALPFILGSISINENDDVHCGNNLSASRLCHCLRAIGIEDNVPSVVNVMAFDVTTRGTALHEFCQKHAPNGTLVEYELPRPGAPRPLMFEGTEFEIPIRGRFDILYKDTALLEDYKGTSEYSQKKRFERGSAEPEWSVAFSVYKHLLKKCEGIDVKRGAAWSHAWMPAAKRDMAWIYLPVSFMSEEEILDFAPLDGAWTIAQMIREYKKFLARLDGGMPAIEAVAMIPLMGADTNQSKKRFKACDYCSVAGKCAELAGEAEW